MSELKPSILAVAEIVLSVADLEKMKDFYQEILGFKMHSEASHRHGMEPDQGEDPTIVFLTIQYLDTPLTRSGHPQMLVLIDYQNHVFARKRLKGHDITKTTLNHLAFEISFEDYDAHLDRLTNLGLDPEEVEFPIIGAKAIFFRDPEGNVLEFICPNSE